MIPDTGSPNKLLTHQSRVPFGGRWHGYGLSSLPPLMVNFANHRGGRASGGRETARSVRARISIVGADVRPPDPLARPRYSAGVGTQRPMPKTLQGRPRCARGLIHVGCL